MEIRELKDRYLYLITQLLLIEREYVTLEGLKEIVCPFIM